MPALELRISRAAFADSLGAMRDWLDHKAAGAVKFGTTSEPDGTVVVRIEIGNADLAREFAAAFGEAVAVPLPPATPAALVGAH